MSLKLNIDTCPPLVTKTYETGGTHVILIGDEQVGLEDFCELVKYVLTNTDLLPNDPRLELLEVLKEARVTEGYNPGKERLKIGVIGGRYGYC